MTILNFPAGPEDGAIYTVNGISYVYNNGAWSSNSAESNNSLYVNVDGDNMTGDLTLGTDKIVLDAGNGSITADGRADFGSTSHNDRAVVGINSSASGASVTGKNWANGGFVWQGYNNADDNINETSAIKTTGDAIFSGSVTTGVGVIFPDGTTQITAASGGGGGGDGEVGSLLEVCTVGNFTSTDINIGNSVVDPRIQLQESDGSVITTGRVAAGSNTHDGNALVGITNTALGDDLAPIYGQQNGTGDILDLRQGNDKKVTVKNDGAIEAAGNIKLGDPTGNSNKSGLLLGADGAVASYVSNSDTGSDARIYVYNGDLTDYTAQINADGSITAANDIKAGERDPSATDARGVRIAVESGNGGVYVCLLYTSPSPRDRG